MGVPHHAVALATALIEFDSRNPTLVPGAPGERGVACFLGEILDGWGFSVDLVDASEGRPNLIASAGRGDGPTLMLNGHLDVVGVDGMTHLPFAPQVQNGRLYGRGSADMKGGIAAMCVAAREAVEVGLDGEVVITAVIDEEYDSLGTRALIRSMLPDAGDAGARVNVRTDAVVITEPTRLAICPAHRGFVWAEVEVHGRAAHGSRYDLGVDAITHAAFLLAELDRVQQTEFMVRTHPLLGRASLHASTILGGTGLSTYPESCTVAIERRTIPGESAHTFLEELNDACHTVRAHHPTFDATVRLAASQGTSDVSREAPVVRALERALQAECLPVSIEGMRAWTDAALFNEAGIPTVCFGPGDLALAHAMEEYIPVYEIETATRVLRHMILDWCNPMNSA